MKKIISIFIITLLINSCSNNDDNDENQLKYSVELEEICRENGNDYCITKQEYERIKEILNTSPLEPCKWISIKDINGNGYSGYVRSLGAISSNSNCN